MTGWNGWASLGGQLAGGSPLVARNADGRLEVFGTTSGPSGPELAHVWQTSPNNGWSSWASFGPPPAEFLGAVAVAANADGHLEAFGRVGLMSSGALYHLWQTAPNNGWSGWDTLGGDIGPQFVLVATNADGRLEVLTVASGPGSLQQLAQTAPNNGWGGWTLVSSLPGSFPVQLAVGSNADGRLELFNVGSGGLWHSWQTTPGGAWSAWNALGAPSGVSLSGVAVANDADGRLEVFSVGNNALWHIWQSAPGGGWSTWDTLGNPGTASLGAPTVAANADGRLEAFVAGLDDALFHIWQTAPNSGWSSWDSLGGAPAGPVAVGANADGRLEVFAAGRAVPGQVWHRWQTTPGGAWSSTPQDWQQLSLAGPVHRLYTTTDDAVLALSDAGLFRSHDSGTSWTQLPLPSGWGVVEVDPTAGGQVLYAATSAGLEKSTDAGASWSLVLPSSSLVIGVAVSPANASLVYVAIGRGSGEFTFQRSTDAGSSWTVLEDVPHGDLCTWTCFLLQGHPLQAERAFRNIACVAGRNVPGGLALQQTTNAGAAWSDIFHPLGLYPARLVGGWGSNPQRWYVGAYLAAAPGGGSFSRSDDDGATWATVLTLGAGESVGGLAYHLSAADRLYAGLTTGVVQFSPDAGASWSQIASGLGGMEDVALSRDEGALFAATPSGLWRLYV